MPRPLSRRVILVLRAKARELGVTQAQLADAAGVTQSKVSKVFRGEMTFDDFDLVEAWCSALEVDLADVVRQAQAAE